MTLAPQPDDEFLGRKVLDRYRIVHRLASGGMGVIYLARNEGAKGFVKPVVIKRILPQLVGDEEAIGMFAREARIMSNLSHPNIVAVLDFAEDENAYLMVLEYVHGFHLGRWNRYVKKTNGLFPIEPAIHIVVSVLDALHYAHNLTNANGDPLRIVHRDVSLSNILVDTEGRIKLTDFGIARMKTDQTAASDKKSLKGTFSYMAPEILKMGDASPRSDLYSAAVVLHELLTGTNEFWAKDVAATAWRVLDHVVSPVEAARPDVPAGLDAVLQKALAKEPTNRYEDAQAFAKELRRLRTMSAEDAAKLVAEAADRDFLNPRMAEVLGATDLSTLDHKWRDPSRIDSWRNALRPTRRPRRTSDASTVTGGAQVATQVAPIGTRGFLIAGAVGIGAAVVATTLLSRRPAPANPAPGVIMIEGSVSAVGVSAQPISPSVPPEDVAPAAGGAGRSDLGPATIDVAASKATGSTNKPPRSRTDGLTRAFARQEPQIARCFSQHGASLQGNPQISVRFEVGTNGRVTTTQIQPDAVSSTPLGGCIAGVARATDFGRQPEPVSFRIPITAKRTQ